MNYREGKFRRTKVHKKEKRRDNKKETHRRRECEKLQNRVAGRRVSARPDQMNEGSCGGDEEKSTNCGK